jgi:hypothetical protein
MTYQWHMSDDHSRLVSSHLENLLQLLWMLCLHSKARLKGQSAPTYQKNDGGKFCEKSHRQNCFHNKDVYGLYVPAHWSLVRFGMDDRTLHKSNMDSSKIWTQRYKLFSTVKDKARVFMPSKHLQLSLILGRSLRVNLPNVNLPKTTTRAFFMFGLTFWQVDFLAISLSIRLHKNSLCRRKHSSF